MVGLAMCFSSTWCHTRFQTSQHQRSAIHAIEHPRLPIMCPKSRSPTHSLSVASCILDVVSCRTIMHSTLLRRN